MKSFGVFLIAIIAMFVLLANFGPMVLFALGVYLLYVIWKKFAAAEETGAKVLWVILGLIVFSITLSNVYAIVGLFAVYVLYVLFFRKDDSDVPRQNKQQSYGESDPFNQFEQEWSSLKKN
ncbi:lmo0954 family membrane protein [Salisediminibacterium beveridgei]|uniref:Permease n=1 Tax=Salisediminibacterium beveridgei TaxID=632773 RepID=A0A1D7QTM4_9BACI|nr:flagellar basal body rod protein [Salisediminibacterium beveridgei]AOM82339.1 Permease [Salisediminibacterium beveridgei]